MEQQQHYCITITRQFGSLGRTIALKVGETLNIPCLDRDIVLETANRMNLPISDIGDQEETATSTYYYRRFPSGFITPMSVADEIFEVESSIIIDHAEKEDCIIVGRCANSVLRNHPRHLNFYIQAPYKDRLYNCVHTLHLEEHTAARMIRDVDVARDRYMRRYIRDIENDFTDRDIILNSTTFGVDGTADIIVTLAKKLLKIDETQ